VRKADKNFFTIKQIFSCDVELSIANTIARSGKKHSINTKILQIIAINFILAFQALTLKIHSDSTLLTVTLTELNQAPGKHPDFLGLRVR